MNNLKIMQRFRFFLFINCITFMMYRLKAVKQVNLWKRKDFYFSE